MPGRSGARDLDDDAVFDFAATNARLTLALRGFFHPAAGRDLLWNPGQAARLRPLVASIREAGRRQIVERVLDRYEERVLPRFDFLPAQVVHGDFTLDNVLVDERGRVSGITDFGDLGFGTRAGDLAIDLCSILRVGGEEPFRTARIAIDGYQSRIPLEDEELDLLGDLVFARLAALVAISAWRVERYPENAEYIQSWDDESWALLEQFDELGFDDVAHELGASRVASTGELLQRRSQVLGSALTGLTYRKPVHVVRGEGVWLFDADGTRLLDCYNNVPVVGHCHPRVTEAVVRQTRLLNTHSRYLYEPLVELAERLVATMPPETGLDAVMLVNSGSEANDLAWRLATTRDRPPRRDRDRVRLPRGHDRDRRLLAGGVAAGLQARARGDDHAVRAGSWRRPSSGWTSAVSASRRRISIAASRATASGRLPRRTCRRSRDATREAGGLVVADEVQAGHGRTGSTCGRSRSTASRRTSSRSGSRWGTATRSPR